MALPFIKSDSQAFDQLQTKWTAELNPLLAKPLSSANVLTSVTIVTGSNVINHKLGRQMQGWFISDINAAASLFRSQPMNSATLTLTSSAPCVINLVVY